MKADIHCSRYLKFNEIKVRFDELPHIFNKFETAQSDWNFLTTQIIQWTDNLKINTLRLRQSSMNFSIL
jgi:hypothetical protein